MHQPLVLAHTPIIIEKGRTLDTVLVRTYSHTYIIQYGMPLNRQSLEELLFPFDFGGG